MWLQAMSISKLRSVFRIFSGTEPTTEEQSQLYKEVALMILSRATSADSNINQLEVEKVRDVLKVRTGEEFSDSDIRVAAQSTIFESAPLERYIRSTARKLKPEDRLSIARGLAEVIEADDRVTEREVTFFNNVAQELELTPAQLIGLESKA